MNEGHLNHSGIVHGGLLEAGEDAAVLFQPANESFDDVSIAIGGRIKLDLSSAAIFVGFRWYHRLNVHGLEHGIDPVGSKAFVGRNLFWPGNRSSFQIDNTGISVLQQSHQGLSLMNLSSGQLKCQRVPRIVACQMKLCGKTAS
jgi:hypothetical protein